jgi:ADP-ribosyl-[dinitrogen reductase] hydrolase
MDLSRRSVGCLVGLAVGDALGAPLQYMTEPQIQIKHGTVREMIGGGWLLLRPGQHTDDTALTLLLGRSLVERGGLDLEDLSRRYVEWYQGSPKDLTGVLRTSLSLLADGVGVDQAARKAHDLCGEDSADNTSLMRCAPLALFFGQSHGEMLEAVVRESSLTHRDPIAAAGAAAFCTVLSLVLLGVPREELAGRASAALEKNELGLKNILPDLSAKKRVDLRPRPFVLDTLEVSLHQFLHGRSFEEALVSTANLGGESDTTTALVGALAGAYWGPDEIPHRWLRALSGRTAIRDLALELFRCRTGAPPG